MPRIDYLPDERPEPWERQAGESAPAWQAFQTYRDLAPGKRSIRAVARSLGKSPTLTGRWSATWSWSSRVAAYDDHRDRERRQEEADERRRLRVRHRRIAAMWEQKVVERLNALRGDEMTVESAIRAFDLAVRVSRDGGPDDDEHSAAAAYRALWERLRPPDPDQLR